MVQDSRRSLLFKNVSHHRRVRFTATKLRRAEDGTNFDVIIIGGGISAMACAASLARIGKRCCVLEQGEQLGGGAHVFALQGYEFETGVHCKPPRSPCASLPVAVP